MDIYSGVGTKVRFIGINGYDLELKEAKEKLSTTEMYEVESMEVGNYSSSVKFKGVNGAWNSVMLDNMDTNYPKHDRFKFSQSTGIFAHADSN
jgi:hypothetical protein